MPELQKAAAARHAAARPDAPRPEIVVATATFGNTWREQIGSGDALALKHYGAAHTKGDAVVTFEKANVVHMGDLVFNRRHPVIDRPGGASIAGWIKALDKAAKDHGKDTIFIFGHAGPKFAVTGTAADLAYQRDYLLALLEFVRRQMKEIKLRDDIVAITEPLKDFPDHGPLNQERPRRGLRRTGHAVAPAETRPFGASFGARPKTARFAPFRCQAQIGAFCAYRVMCGSRVRPSGRKRRAVPAGRTPGARAWRQSRRHCSCRTPARRLPR